VNGRAWSTTDPEILDTMPMQGKRPWFAIGVEVEECFLHCGKALIRSKLWEPEAWPDLATVPTGAQIYKTSRGDVSETVEEIERGLVESYRTRLY
jgi:hypothetical protein